MFKTKTTNRSLLQKNKIYVERQRETEREKQAGERHRGPTGGVEPQRGAGAAAAAADECFGGGGSARGCRRAR